MDEQTRCISHEIRNQLSICELYSRVIRKNLQNLDVKNDSIDNALNCIEKSVKMINNSLLDLKLLNNYSIRKCNLDVLLNEAIELAKIYSDKVEIFYQSECTVDVEVDEHKFIACVVNILKNAIEAIENSGEIKVVCGVFKNAVSVKLINNGKQIPEEKQKAIFEKGFTTKQTGCGLGLHICKSSLQKMNGDLKLNYSTERTTEFEIILPVV